MTLGRDRGALVFFRYEPEWGDEPSIGKDSECLGLFGVDLDRAGQVSQHMGNDTVLAGIGVLHLTLVAIDQHVAPPALFLLPEPYGAGVTESGDSPRRPETGAISHHLRLYVTCFQVIVHHPHGLHVGVHGRGPDEREAALLEGTR